MPNGTNDVAPWEGKTDDPDVEAPPKVEMNEAISKCDEDSRRNEKVLGVCHFYF